MEENKGRESIKRSPVLILFDRGFQLLGVIIFAMVIFYLCSGITVVKPDEVAMILRFGKLAGPSRALSVHKPGLLLALPKPIDEIVRVKIKKIYELDIRDLRFNLVPEGEARVLNQLNFDSNSIDPETEGYCLTGDNNIIQAHIVVKYQISDALDYVFKQDSSELLLKNIVMSAMVQSVGEIPVNTVLSEGKKQLSATVFKRAQGKLDAVGSGLSLVSVEFNELVPPRNVMQDFKNVQNAFIDKETKVKVALSYREQEIPLAEGERDVYIREAEAYAADVLSTARGKSLAYTQLVTEYEKAPEVVRERLYRETIEETFGWSGRATLVPAPVGSKYENFRLVIPGE